MQRGWRLSESAARLNSKADEQDTIMTDTPRRMAVSPPGVPAPIKSYYSNAIRVESGPLLFIAGQIPINEAGDLVGKGDIQKQAEQVFANIAAILAGSDATLSDLVKVTVYVTDISFMGQLAPLRARLFPKDGPASVCVQVSALAEPDILIEIEGVAVVS